MGKDQLLVRFGKILQRERKSRNLSQEAFAELADVHRTYVGMLERGEKNVTLKNIGKIAKALKVRIPELLEDL